MRQVSILTDNSAQFPTASFPGHQLVHVIPLHIQVHGQFFAEGKGVKAHDLPDTVRPGMDPHVFPPRREEFSQYYSYLSQRFDEIVVLLHSSQLTRSVASAQQAAEEVKGQVEVFVIDSQTTAVGLGLLTQVAAQAAADGLSGLEIERLLRGQIPHVYGFFLIPGLTYLHHAGLMGSAQALVGEKLGVLPLFVMERGQLVPVQKARSTRHLVDCLHEFVGEFGGLDHIAIVQGVPPYEQEVRALRERFNLDFPQVPVSEHIIGPALAALVGPHSLGLFTLERGV